MTDAASRIAEQRVGEAERDDQRAADREVREVGDPAERGVGDGERAPAGGTSSARSAASSPRASPCGRRAPRVARVGVAVLGSTTVMARNGRGDRGERTSPGRKSPRVIRPAGGCPASARRVRMRAGDRGLPADEVPPAAGPRRARRALAAARRDRGQRRARRRRHRAGGLRQEHAAGAVGGALRARRVGVARRRRPRAAAVVGGADRPARAASTAPATALDAAEAPDADLRSAC